MKPCPRCGNEESPVLCTYGGLHDDMFGYYLDADYIYTCDECDFESSAAPNEARAAALWEESVSDERIVPTDEYEKLVCASKLAESIDPEDEFDKDLDRGTYSRSAYELWREA